MLVVDLKTGDTASAVPLDGRPMGTVALIENIPPGHKVALRDIPGGRGVIKDGRSSGGDRHRHRAELDGARGAGHRRDR